MEIRDAVEADAGRLAELASAPQEVMRNLVHDRTVRVAERDGDLRGLVSFDAREGTVHVTQVEGDPDTYERLLGEPVRFARAEGMAVEMLVPETESAVAERARAVGFESDGAGPRFDGTPTTRFRLAPE